LSYGAVIRTGEGVDLVGKGRAREGADLVEEDAIPGRADEIDISRLDLSRWSFGSDRLVAAFWRVENPMAREVGGDVLRLSLPRLAGVLREVD
jgi:hypothetical protein